MRPDGRVEITSNITDDTMLDEPEPVLSEDTLLGRQITKEPEVDEEEKTSVRRMLEAIMGFAGGIGWQDEDSPETVINTEPLDDPFSELSIVVVAKVIKNTERQCVVGGGRPEAGGYSRVV